MSLTMEPASTRSLIKPPKPALPLTPGQARSLIAVKKEMANQCHSDSHEFWRLQQQIAELERLENDMERFVLDHFWLHRPPQEQTQ